MLSRSDSWRGPGCEDFEDIRAIFRIVGSYRKYPYGNLQTQIYYCGTVNQNSKIFPRLIPLLFAPLDLTGLGDKDLLLAFRRADLID